MSRILNRPLFRRGGSATGITSGLDRPGYDPGGRVDYPAMYEQAEEKFANDANATIEQVEEYLAESEMDFFNNLSIAEEE